MRNIQIMQHDFDNICFVIKDFIVQSSCVPTECEIFIMSKLNSLNNANIAYIFLVYAVLIIYEII